MTRTVFAVSLMLALALTRAGAEELKATLTTADSAELPLAARITPVAVTNFPVVQEVTGNVRVAGEVSISNLPQLCGAPTFAVLELLALAVVVGPDCGCGPCYRYTSTSFDVAGWKFLSGKLVVTTNAGLTNLHASAVAFRNFSTEPFGESYAWSTGNSQIVTSAIVGAEAVLMSSSNYCLADVNFISSAYFSIYLSR